MFIYLFISKSTDRNGPRVTYFIREKQTFIQKLMWQTDGLAHTIQKKPRQDYL
jgi:hypothetical protein